MANVISFLHHVVACLVLEKYSIDFIVSPIPHKIVEIHEYVLKEAFYVRTGWFRKKLIPKDSIIEMVTLHDDNC